jgi:hypothetical protein
MDRAYRLAMFCGASPLLVGVSIFVLWLLTRWDLLMIAGILTLAAGPVLCAFAFLNLSHFLWLARREPDLSPRRRRLAVFWCGSLLLANFPVAVGIIYAVIEIESAYTVVIHNGSAQPLDGVRVGGGGCDVYFGSIPPQGVARRSFWIQHDGELSFHATSGTIFYALSPLGYITNGAGGYRTINVNPDRTILVTDEYGQPTAQQSATP